jgi:hypothetical protein
VHSWIGFKLINYSSVPQWKQYFALDSWPSVPQLEQGLTLWANAFLRLVFANSAETMPVGTAIIPYPMIITREAMACPSGVIGEMSP